MTAFETVTARAPGKLILMGEHSAVYGRPAVVTALGLYTRATVRRSDRATHREGSPAVAWRLPDIGVDGSADWEELVDTAARYRQAWERQMDDATSTDLERLRRGDAARVVKLALAECLRAGEAQPPAVEVEVGSGLPVGAGFGSSASVAVAVSAALRVLLDGVLDRAAIEATALEVERREHGRPSGVDHATVLYGGVLWMERSAEGRPARRRLDGVTPALEGLTVLDSGRPAESTGEMVRSVRRRYSGRAGSLDPILDAMEADVRQLREWLLDEGRDPLLLVDLMRDFEHRLEELGVVPRAIRQLVRQVEAEGGAAKISGAGAASGSAAGSLLVYHPKRPARSLACLAELRALDAELAVAGVEVVESV